MELAQNKRPWEWMVKPTAQKEWIEGKGILLWLAMFFGMGAGLYLVATIFSSLWGMLVGWLIVALGFGGLHIAYLGQPLRFWRMVLRPQTSWISRGLLFSVILLGAGIIQMALLYWAIAPAIATFFGVIAGIFAFMAALYTGFAMNYIRAIPFWNNALLPVLVVCSEILGGTGIALALALTVDPVLAANIAIIELGIKVMLTAVAVIVAIYMWSSTYGPTGSKEAVMALLGGQKSFSIPFWLTLVVIGIIVPLVLAWYPSAGGVTHTLLFTAIACEFIGGLSLRYSILRAGIYAPLI